MIHESIPQHFNWALPITECPNCHHKQSQFDYGDIDTPPIAVQLRGYTGEWQARRCYCSKCKHMWDVVSNPKVMP